MAFGQNPITYTKTNTSNATIPAFTAVVQDLAHNDGVVLSTANSRSLGIAPEYDLKVGEVGPITFLGITRWLLGGTVNPGGLLKSDSLGRGVPIANFGGLQNVVAISAEAGVLGDVILVQLLQGQFVPYFTSSSSSSSRSSSSSKSSSSSSKSSSRSSSSRSSSSSA